MLGFPRHSRLVGQSLKMLPPNLAYPRVGDVENEEFVPWHRVVNSKGIISPRDPVSWCKFTIVLLSSY